MDKDVLSYITRLVAAVAISLIGAYVAVSVYAALQFTLVERVRVSRDPAEIAVYENVAFTTSDSTILRGWYFPGSGTRAAVLVHGKGANRLDSNNLAFIAKTLHAEGYSVLTFDMRGHGASDGDRFSLGQYERYDVAAAVDHLVARGHPLQSIALIGESMGASTALQTLRLRPDVGAVVSDSAYADGSSIIYESGPSSTGPMRIFTGGILIAARILLGFDADAVDPERTVRASFNRPFLFIHCSDDALIPVHHSLRLREASVHPDSVLWIVPGCEHGGASEVARVEYTRRLLAFLDVQLPR